MTARPRYNSSANATATASPPAAKARHLLARSTIFAVTLASASGFVHLLSTDPVPRSARGAQATAPAAMTSDSTSLAIQSNSSTETSTTLDLSGLQARFEQVGQKVAPSVVAISVAIESRGDEDTVRPEDMSGRKLTTLLDRTTRTVGTGFVISADGLILTNEHVICEAEQIWCTTDDGKVFPAFVVGSDPRQDLAVLRIPAANLKPVAFAEPTSVKRGSWAIAIGNPYGLAGEGRLAMAVGVVSATGRSLPRLSTRENRLYSDLIQTTAEINPGNSGGPLFDLEGKVFGVNTAVVLPQKNTNGIGFALPITKALLAHIEELKQGREIAYGDLGLLVSQPSARDRKAAGAPSDVGVKVDEIEPAGPCQGALMEGDIITSIGDSDVSSVDAYATLATALRAASPVKATVWRNEKRTELLLTPRKKEGPGAGVSRSTQRYRWNGMLLGPIPANWSGGKRPAGGLMVISVDAGSRTKLAPGTVIQAIAGLPVRNVEELQNVLAKVPPEQTTMTVLK